MYGRKMNVCLADGTAMPTYAHDAMQLRPLHHRGCKA